jgi:hypothetical protein
MWAVGFSLIYLLSARSWSLVQEQIISFTFALAVVECQKTALVFLQVLLQVHCTAQFNAFTHIIDSWILVFLILKKMAI